MAQAGGQRSQGREPVRLPQARIGFLALGHVTHHGGEELLRHHFADDEFHVHGRPVLAEGGHLVPGADDVARPSTHERLHAPEELHPLLLRHQHADALPKELLGAVAEDPAGGRVGPLDHAARIDGDDGVGNAVQDGTHAALALRQLLVCLLSIDEVRRLACQEVQDALVAIANEAGPAAERAQRAQQHAVAADERRRLVGAEAALIDRRDERIGPEVLRVVHVLEHDALVHRHELRAQLPELLHGTCQRRRDAELGDHARGDQVRVHQVEHPCIGTGDADGHVQEVGEQRVDVAVMDEAGTDVLDAGPDGKVLGKADAGIRQRRLERSLHRSFGRGTAGNVIPTIRADALEHRARRFRRGTRTRRCAARRIGHRHDYRKQQNVPQASCLEV